MLALKNPIWLLLTDSFLGVVVAALVLVLFIVLIKEIVLRIRYSRSKRIARDLHAFVTKHGITMADGGAAMKKVNKGQRKKRT